MKYCILCIKRLDKREICHIFSDVPVNFEVFVEFLLYLPSHYMWRNWKSCPRGRRNWALTVLFVFCVLNAGEYIQGT